MEGKIIIMRESLKNSKELEILKEFIKMPLFSTDEVFKKFSEDTDGHLYMIDGHKFYFKPGTREDRILLIAHADTVWDNRYKKFPIDYTNEDINYKREMIETENIYCNNPKFNTGIGADDRAGCAMAWLLKDSGNSVLITDEEEVGGLTARAIMTSPELRDIINSHNFMLQFDMNGSKWFKCYGAGSEEFKQMMEEKTGYDMRPNFSYTDISFLGKTICGANISIGYYNEHTPDECLNKQDWLEAYKTIERVVNGKHKKYLVEPEFANRYIDETYLPYLINGNFENAEDESDEYDTEYEEENELEPMENEDESDINIQSNENDKGFEPGN